MLLFQVSPKVAVAALLTFDLSSLLALLAARHPSRYPSMRIPQHAAPGQWAALGCASVPFGSHPEVLPSVSCLFLNLVIPVGLIIVITVKYYVNLERSVKRVGFCENFKLNVLGRLDKSQLLKKIRLLN